MPDIPANTRVVHAARFHHFSGGDPFLAELYRRVGALDTCTNVQVWNKVRHADSGSR